MYLYYYLINKSLIEKTKSVVIYGAGKAGVKLESEFSNTEYKVKYFVDDKKTLQGRSIDSVQVLSKEKLKKKIASNKFDLLVIAIPSAPKSTVKEIYNDLSEYFKEIQILPSIDDILKDKEVSRKELLDCSNQQIVAEQIAVANIMK